MQKLQIKAFTLVELIVVITILAILGTIAFISLQGYSAQSRDATRISDLSTMRTGLELFQLDAGKYPIPTTGTDVTYSGGVVWTQGIFGDSVYKNVDALDKVPSDPLTSSKYTYTVTSTRNEYELAGALEGDDFALLEQTNAGTTEATAFVTGTYNGQMTKTLSGETCDILAVPTIIASDIETSTDLVEITNNKRFVYNGYNNLPASYKSSKFDVSGGFDFKVNTLVAYTDTGSCTALTSKSSYDARVELLQGLQASYTGTTLKGVGKIKRILALSIDENDVSTEVQNFAGSFVNNNFAGEVEIVSSSTSGSGGGGNTGPVVTKISAGPFHTCVIINDGSVKCWGGNNYGALGDGTTISSAVPVDSTDIVGTVTDIQVGWYHSCILLSDGSMKCWGRNVEGQIGDGTTTTRNNPLQVPGLTSGVTDISVGLYNSSCAVISGGIKCWGYNNDGQIGNGSSGSNQLSPIDVNSFTAGTGISSLASGSYHGCALKDSGEVRCWGYNGQGQLGNGNNTSYNTSQLVSGLTGPFTKVYVGTSHSCVLHTDGSVKCWGRNNNQQLGDLSSTNRNTPVQVDGLTAGTVSELSLGGTHSCALLVDGSMKCWGGNNHGQLGDGTIISRNTPTQVDGLTAGTVDAISLGTDHTCALLTSGGVKCWGYNNNSRTLGSSAAIETPNSTPLSVDGL